MLNKAHKTRGELEDEISKAIVSFEREYMGRGPREVKTYIMDDIVCVRLNGMLTKAEKELVTKAGGVELIKKMRGTMLENSTPHLFQSIKEDSRNKRQSLSLGSEHDKRRAYHYLHHAEQDKERRIGQVSPHK